MDKKRAAMFNVVTDCAESVIRVLEDPGGVVGVDMAVMIIEIARIQLETIAATPARFAQGGAE